MKEYYVIREYDCFVKKSSVQEYSDDKYNVMPEKTFDMLENFVLQNKNEEKVQAMDLMNISSKRRIGKIISSKNYVGIIELPNGTQIEILPKIYLKNTKEKEIAVNETRKIFLNILKALRECPFKQFNVSSLGRVKNNLYEVFISMFVKEVYRIIKTGVKSDYLSREENEKFLKGKIKFNENIRYNIIHKERFYIDYDEFNINIPENKIIKSTVTKLLKMTISEKNRKDLKQLLFYFDDVDISKNLEKDFSSCKINRNMESYKLVLIWARVFLLNCSFTSFKGSEKAVALLFPMEKLFENYISYLVVKQINETSWNVTTQDTSYYLFDEPTKFQIKPDIILRKDDRTIVMDTKWKILNLNNKNYGISQSDMYQMYAYSKKYNAEKIVLIYPYNEYVSGISEVPIIYKSNDNVEVQIHFVNLQIPESSIINILKLIIWSRNE